MRRLLGQAVSDVVFTPQEFVFRFRSPTEFVEVFRDYYGPVRKAFDALDERGREQLYDDLSELATQHDREPGPTIAVPSEYVEAVAVRAS